MKTRALFLICFLIFGLPTGSVQAQKKLVLLELDPGRHIIVVNVGQNVTVRPLVVTAVGSQQPGPAPPPAPTVNYKAKAIEFAATVADPNKARTAKLLELNYRQVVTFPAVNTPDKIRQTTDLMFQSATAATAGAWDGWKASMDGLTGRMVSVSGMKAAWTAIADGLAEVAAAQSGLRGPF